MTEDINLKIIYQTTYGKEFYDSLIQKLDNILDKHGTIKSLPILQLFKREITNATGCFTFRVIEERTLTNDLRTIYAIKDYSRLIAEDLPKKSNITTLLTYKLKDAIDYSKLTIFEFNIRTELIERVMVHPSGLDEYWVFESTPNQQPQIRGKTIGLLVNEYARMAEEKRIINTQIEEARNMVGKIQSATQDIRLIGDKDIQQRIQAQLKQQRDIMDLTERKPPQEKGDEK